MSYPTNNPWDKDRFGYEPPRASRGPLVVVLIVLGLLGVVAVLVAVAVGLTAAQFPWNGEFAELTPELDTAAPAHPHDWAATKAAFSSASSAAADRQHARLERLLNEFLRCANEDDGRGLRKIVDYPRFFREMCATRFKPLVEQYDRDAIVRHLIETVGGLSGWQRLRVVRCEKLPRPGEVLVYAHGFHANGYSNPVRFWVLDRGRPLVFDWEMTEYGARETGDWAVYYAYSDDGRMESFYRAREKIGEAETLWNDGEADDARATLAEAANARVPLVLHDQLLLSVAYVYLSWNDFGAVESLVSRMISPDATPGAHMVVAQIHQRRGDLAACVVAAEKFESVVGVTPQTIALRVECFESEERWAEAAQAQRRLLAILPDDVPAIERWGLMLGETEKGPLTAYLQAQRNAAQLAKDLARKFTTADDIDAALAVAELLRGQEEHAAWVELVDGCVKHADGDYLGAAAHFQRALDATDDEDLRDEVQYRWYDALAEAKEHVQAYEQASDPQDAFDYFVGGYEEGESSLTGDEFAALVAAHRKKMPDEPWGIYYASLAASEKVDAEEAERLLRAGLANLNTAGKDAASATAEGDEEEKFDDEEYLRESLRSQLATLLVENGQALEAYATVPPADETFRTVAAQLQHEKDRTGELQSLIDQHAAAQPDDVWLDYYRAVVAQREERFDEADRLLAHMQQTAAVEDDEALARAVRYLRIDVQHAAGEHLAALREIPPLDETFDALAHRLQSAENWPQLLSLIEAYEAEQGADDPQAIRWRANLYMAQKDDAALAELLFPWPESAAWETWQASSMRAELLAALLRLGRLNDAQQFAQQCRDEHDNPWALVRVHLARGNIAEAIALVDRHRASSYRLHDIYQNTPELTHIWEPQCIELRRRHPPPLAAPQAFGSAVALFRDRPQLSSAELQNSLRDLLSSDVQMSAVPQASQVAKTIVVTAGEMRIILVAGGDRYQHDDKLLVRELRDESLREVWQAHRGWLMVNVLADEMTVDAAGRLAGRIAARIDAGNAALLHVGDYLLAAGEASRRLIDSDWTDDQLAAAGEQLWIYRDAEVETSESWNRRRSLRELDERFHTPGNSQQCFVQAELSVAHASERPWLRLVRIVRPGHRGRSFVAEFVEPSALAPHFAAGEYVRLDAYEILNWKCIDGEEVVFGWTQ